MNFSLETLEPIAGKVIEALLSYVPSLAGAIALLVFGWMAIGLLMRGIRRVFDRANFDEALESFIISLAGIGLKLILLVMVAAMLGVQTSSLVALLSVDFTVRVFAKPDDSWTLPFEMNEAVKKAFDKAGISIPFPQRDVHHFYPEGGSTNQAD